MRVLQAVQALPPHTYGGSELYTASVAETLDARGHKVAIASPHGGDPVDARVFDLPTPSTADVQNDDGLPDGPVDVDVDSRFEELLTDFRPDIVHLQHFKGISTTIPGLCTERDIACVATLHDFWGICHREQLYHPEGRRCRGPDSIDKCTDCYLTAAGRMDPVESRRHGADEGASSKESRTASTDGSGSLGVREASDVHPSVRDQYEQIVEQRRSHVSEALARTDRLISPSSFLRDRYVRYGISPTHIDQIRNGIPVDQYEDTGFDGPPIRLGYAGRVSPEKGVHLLVEAFDQLRSDVTLDVFGRFAPETEPYHAHLSELADDDVSFNGWYEDPAAPYRQMDVLVLPSIWYENSPLVIQEANASGLPTVVSDIGGMAELVTDGVDGLTFAAGDARALASRLSELVEDAGRLEQLRLGVEQPTRLEDHVTELEALYSECVSQ